MKTRQSTRTHRTPHNTTDISTEKSRTNTSIQSPSEMNPSTSEELEQTSAADSIQAPSSTKINDSPEKGKQVNHSDSDKVLNPRKHQRIDASELLRHPDAGPSTSQSTAKGSDEKMVEIFYRLMGDDGKYIKDVSTVVISSKTIILHFIETVLKSRGYSEKAVDDTVAYAPNNWSDEQQTQLRRNPNFIFEEYNTSETNEIPKTWYLSDLPEKMGTVPGYFIIIKGPLNKLDNVPSKVNQQSSAIAQLKTLDDIKTYLAQCNMLSDYQRTSLVKGAYFAEKPVLERKEALKSIYEQFYLRHFGEDGIKIRRSQLCGLFGSPGEGKSRGLDEVASLNPAHLDLIEKGASTEKFEVFKTRLVNGLSVCITFNSSTNLVVAEANFNAEKLLVYRLLHAYFAQNSNYNHFVNELSKVQVPDFVTVVTLIRQDSLLRKNGNDADSYFVLCVDEVLRSKSTKNVLSCLGQALDQLPWLYTIFSMLDRTVNIGDIGTNSGRFLFWIPITLLSFEASKALVKDVYENYPNCHTLIDRFVAEAMGHPRTLESFSSLAMEGKLFLNQNISILLERFHDESVLRGMWSGIPLTALLVALKGVPIREETLVATDMTAARAISSGFYYNSSPGRAVGFVPRISLFHLRFCDELRLECNISIKEVIHSLLLNDAGDVSGQALEKLQYRSEIVRRIAWDPENAEMLWSRKRLSHASSSPTMSLGQLYLDQNFGPKIIVTQKFGNVMIYESRCETVITNGEMNFNRNQLLTHVYRFGSNNPGFDTLIFELSADDKQSLIAVFIENRYSLASTKNSSVSESVVYAKKRKCKSIFNLMKTKCSLMTEMVFILAAYRDSVPVIADDEILCLNRNDLNELFTPSLSSLAALYEKSRDDTVEHKNRNASDFV